jgi:hypothetical protein
LSQNLQVVLQQSPVNALILGAFDESFGPLMLQVVQIARTDRTCKMWRKSRVLKNEAHFSLHTGRV